MSELRGVVGRVVGVLVGLDRRAGAYAFGVVFGTKAERTYGNFPNFRQAPGDRAAASRRAGLEADALQRAVATAVIAGGAAG